ncbi:MAG TPA: nitroreductase family protein [Methylophaga aminisulfidivorans]|jgi:nitroreductase|uniref:Nitroreductase n=2 Tax=Methylophaga TaxID=40222 RepID=F5T061_9GAMM|nr:MULTISPECIES: nitroreductase family protein [Methylophaga]EGL55018.1 nitroreductase [Methylophaga aminisulfidivorans MP]WVI84300.1 nitroreductase family protein [Methylophaga thalassica]GLP99395.1 nitroreductase [Methylophaga thalassica]HIC47722.1 nitroreductase family protein [Methylophaga sp.]HIM39740.1 nitroreductase family protein [Methylophaga aminisulfidivorans]
MDIKEAILTRRSVKHYDPDHTMTKEEVRTLMEHAILSPTAFNLQHWRFINVEDKQLRQEIREASYGQAQVTDSSMLLVLCADLNAWEKDPQRYWRHAPKEVQDFMLPAIEGYYTNHHQGQRDECFRSVGIAASTIMLMAKGMGYDSCPMDGFDFDKVARIINLPHDHVIVMMITIGKKLQEARPRSGQLELDEVLFTDKFPDETK